MPPYLFEMSRPEGRGAWGWCWHGIFRGAPAAGSFGSASSTAQALQVPSGDEQLQTASCRSGAAATAALPPLVAKGVEPATATAISMSQQSCCCCCMAHHGWHSVGHRLLWYSWSVNHWPKLGLTSLLAPRPPASCGVNRVYTRSLVLSQ